MKSKLIIAGIVVGVIAVLVLLTMSSVRFPDEHVPETREEYIPQVTAPMEIEAPDILEVAFSHEPGFFIRAFYLTLASVEGAEIFYTLDGSYPDENSTRYTEAILVDAPVPGPSPAQFDDVTISMVNMFNIRAIAILNDETSEIVTRNFVMGTDVFRRFCKNTLIFALTSDPHGLFDYDDGIFVSGADRDAWRQEYYAEHGHLPTISYSAEDENPSSPANFNRRGREAERAVHVEVFDNMGTLHLSQRAGMRVRGGYSRAFSQKSVELYAREEYGDRNNFRFEFFDDEFDADGELVDRYRRVRLRNGGTDRRAGFIRDELSHALFRQAGYPITQTHRPAAIFLNGEYYGVAWLKSPRTSNHLRRIYGGESERFQFVSGGDQRLAPSWWHGDCEIAVADLHEVSELAMLGFTDDAVFEEFKRRVDLDSLILYYAMQIYINNVDWPNHNMELWRYFPTEEELEDPDLHPYLRDGRWRVFAHDIEAAWGMWDDHDVRANEDTLRDIMTGRNRERWNSFQSSAFLYAMVSRDETREQLANAFADLIEGAFAPANVISVLNDLISQIQNEHNYALRKNIINPDSEWWPSIESVTHSRDAIRRFARARPQAIYDSVRENLGIDIQNR